MARGWSIGQRGLVEGCGHELGLAGPGAFWSFGLLKTESGLVLSFIRVDPHVAIAGQPNGCKSHHIAHLLLLGWRWAHLKVKEVPSVVNMVHGPVRFESHQLLPGLNILLTL